MKAKIQYKIKCIVEIPGFFTHDLKIKQHLVIHERLDRNIEPKHHLKEATVRTLCCIPRGPVRCECWLDKNAYMAGETSQVHVNVDNDSAVDVTHFTTKLIRVIELEAHGHTQKFRDIICQQKYPGTPMHTKRAADVPLLLMGKRGKFVKSSTSSRLVNCKYDIMIEMDIPWAPDVEIYSPVKIYSPQSANWLQWQPPVWIAEAQPQIVCAQLAIPSDILAAQFQNPNFYSAVQVESPVMKIQMGNQNNGGISMNVTAQSSSETTPLLTM